jgi:hypothetical protein
VLSKLECKHTACEIVIARGDLSDGQTCSKWAEVRPKLPVEVRRYVTLCSFAGGNCIKGGKCSFAHNEVEATLWRQMLAEEEARKPFTLNVIPQTCRSVEQQEVCKNPGCTFSHHEQSLDAWTKQFKQRMQSAATKPAATGPTNMNEAQYSLRVAKYVASNGGEVLLSALGSACPLPSSMAGKGRLVAFLLKQPQFHVGSAGLVMKVRLRSESTGWQPTEPMNEAQYCLRVAKYVASNGGEVLLSALGSACPLPSSMAAKGKLKPFLLSRPQFQVVGTADHLVFKVRLCSDESTGWQPYTLNVPPQMCFHVAQNGQCPKPPFMCTFAHSPEQLEEWQNQFKSGVGGTATEPLHLEQFLPMKLRSAQNAADAAAVATTPTNIWDVFGTGESESDGDCYDGEGGEEQRAVLDGGGGTHGSVLEGGQGTGGWDADSHRCGEPQGSKTDMNNHREEKHQLFVEHQLFVGGIAETTTETELHQHFR